MGKIEKIQRFVEKGKVDKLAAITHENDKEIRMAAVDGLGKLIENEMALYALAGVMDVRMRIYEERLFLLWETGMEVTWKRNYNIALSMRRMDKY